MYFLLLFDMVGYTLYRLVEIYFFNSLNVTRCIPTHFSLFCSILGTDLLRDTFYFVRIFFISFSPAFSSFCAVCPPDLRVFICFSIVGSLISRCRHTIYSSSSGHDVHVFLTGHSAAVWVIEFYNFVVVSSIGMNC